MKIKLLLCVLMITATISADAQTGFPFDNEIREFQHDDSLKAPPKDGILFIGSSSIRKWADLGQRFSAEPIIRRGVGGCTLEQVVDYFTPYILFPYKPKKVFVYAGENDIAGGKSGAFVYEEFTKLWGMLERKLPRAEIYFMSIKPSPSRAKFVPEMEIANIKIKAFLADKKKGHYIDVASAILNPATKQPDSALFETDMLHLNKTGYDRWQAVLTPYVK